MIRTVLLSLTVLLACGVCLAQTPPPAKVTVDLTDRPAAEVLAEVGAQIGAQVAFVGPNVPDKVTLNVTDLLPEEAIGKLAEALGASWMRAYLLESQPPPTPFTGDQLFGGLQRQRNLWFESMTDQQRQALVVGVAAGAPPTPGAPPVVTPGGGHAKPPTGQGASPFGGRYDAVGSLMLSRRSDTMSLKLDKTPLPQALFAVTGASSFLVAAGADLTGDVTLAVTDKPTKDVVAEIARQVNAQWRPVYLLSIPRPLTDAELDQMIVDGMSDYATRFWAKPPEERAAEVQKWVDRMGQWGRMAKAPSPDGTPNRVAEAVRAIGPKVLSHLVQYSSGLPATNRAELAPLIRALGQMVGQ
jgi:hypothetical protein